jgi:rubrerythrin
MIRTGVFRTVVLIFVAAAAVALTADRALAASAAPTKTLENLMAAYNGESNAHAKYVAFATKADQEGYAGVASLFRAAAKAEETHATRHAEVIKKLGGTPKADVKAPEVKTTAENLKAAIDGESYERDKMYPEFIAEARATGNKEALRAFNFAISAEGEHAKLYSEAAGNLQTWKQARTFLVCPECGKTVQTIDFGKCPVCYTPAEMFQKIS